jgi:hypothetical protein
MPMMRAGAVRLHAIWLASSDGAHPLDHVDVDMAFLAAASVRMLVVLVSACTRAT